MPSPTPTRFQDSYLAGEPPWVIGEPQPAVVGLAQDGVLQGRILDLGCGTGENTLLLARLGLDVLGVDAAPAAIERARAAAGERGIQASFLVADAFDAEGTGRFDTALDSALFHIFEPADRSGYVDALARRVVDGGLVVVLGLATTEEPRFGPQISEDDLRGAFTGPGWSLEDVRPSSYRGRIVDAEQSGHFAVPVGGTVDLPAWLALVRRTP